MYVDTWDNVLRLLPRHLAARVEMGIIVTVSGFQTVVNRVCDDS